MTIDRPDDRIIRTRNGRCGLVWNPEFTQEWNRTFTLAQKFVDSEVLRLNDKYLPFQSGALKRSGIMGTEIGSGEVCYNSPYARFLYYGKVMVGIQSRSAWARPGEKKEVINKELDFHGAPQRGARWFERMKADHKGEILRGAAEITRRGHG